MYQALYRKYRPRTFDEVVGQSHITETLKRQVEAGRLSHAYLFTGTRGTGKTSCAKILTRAVNCERPEGGNPCNRCPSCVGIEDGSILDVLELDAASNSGVDNVRALRDEAIYTPAAVSRRVYIIDEVHMLSNQAFNALLKILEEPPAHLMFILATTELHKVPATIKSRCQQFAFKRILPGEVAALLSDVAAREGIDLTSEGAALLARLADGGMRDAFSLLDQCIGAGRLDETTIFTALGMAGNLETAKLMTRLAEGDTAGALQTISDLYAAGKDMKSLLAELSSLARDLLVRKTAPRAGAGLLTGGYDEGTLRALGEQLTAPRLLHIMLVLQAALAELARGGTPRVDAELCIIQLADETLDGSAAGLSARIARLEDMAGRAPATAAAQPPTRETRRTPPPAAPPDEDEDAPPWDIPAPQSENEGDATPPWDATAPQEEDEAEYLPPDVSDAQDGGGDAPPDGTPGGGADVFRSILPQLKGKVPPQALPFLSNPAMTSAEYRDGTLTLTANSAVTKAMIDKPEVLSGIAAKAEGLVGRAVVVKVALKTGGSGDKLNDLLAFGKKIDEKG